MREPETIATLAEIGVVLLLFAIGLEFSLADIRKLGRKAAVAGILQVLVTASVVAAALIAAGAVPAKAVFFGLLIAPSSTALVFRLITDRGELQAPHGRLLTGVLLVQDLAVVPMVLLVPALATWAAGTGGLADSMAGAAAPGHGGMTGGALELVLRGLGTIGLIVLGFFAARRLVPWLIARAAAGRSRETFLGAVLLVVAGSAWLSQQAGLSVALGAFLAGLVLAESQHRSQIHADILPFRDLMLSVFFISIGMLLTPWTLLLHPLEVAFATVGMVLWKLIAAAAVARFAGYPWRVAFAAGLGLAHIGEFSFVLRRPVRPPACCPSRGTRAFSPAPCSR